MDEPRFYEGEVCGYVRKYSDTLLIFLLKARRPAKYQDHFVEQLTPVRRIVAEYRPSRGVSTRTRLSQ